MENEMTAKRNGGERRRVLVVDDEEAARYGIRRALGSGDYEVEEAGSVEDARTKMSERAPDLMLLDVNLPGVSGLDFLRELAETTDTSPLVIMVTAYGSERMAGEAVHNR